MIASAERDTDPSAGALDVMSGEELAELARIPSRTANWTYSQAR
ncbi:MULTISPECIES: hypothetical protein [Streptomyces]